jgi:hypothetical protein
VPVVATLKVAVWPAVTVWLAGWLVIEGATSVLPLTVSVAVLLVIFPAELLTTTENFAPLSDVLVVGVV